MGISLAFGGNVFGTATATAGTVINAIVPPRRDAIARVPQLRYTAAGTAHAITGMRSIGRTKVAAAGASGQAVVTVQANPGPAGNALAANDWLAIRHGDGVTRLYQVSSITGTAVTMTASLAATVAVGDDIWMFGAVSDTDPRIGTPHPQFAAAANATTTLADDTTGVLCSHAKDEPLLLQSNNVTAAGSFNLLTTTYTAN
jgi:hypothetical protein